MNAPLGSRRTRSVRPIPLNHSAKAFKDARAIGNPDVVFVRNEPRDIREFDPIRARLNGPARHYRIEDSATVRFTLPDAIITAAIAVLIGMIVAGAFL